MKAKYRILFEAVVCLALLAGTRMSSWFIGGQAWAAPRLQAATGDVVINEIMQNPAAVSDTNGEWFELYNATDADIDINGWTIQDLGTDLHVIDNDGPLVIPAGGYLVLGRNGGIGTNGGVELDYVYGNDITLANGADEIVLIDSADVEMDRVEYDGGPNFPDPTGASMALTDPSLDNNDGASWEEETVITYGDGDYGTPGWENGTSPTPPPVPSLEVVINEVAWAGTAASANDEWIELYNNTAEELDLTGWTLAAADGTPGITLDGSIPPHGFFLLERSHDDQTVSDIPADQTYTGVMENNPSAEVLELRDANGNLIDTANGNGGPWPAGIASPDYYSMERVDPTTPDDDGNWVSNDGVHRNGLDADGDPLNGTPKAANSIWPRPSEAELWAIEYRWGDPPPGFSFADWPVFEGWMNVRIENRGAGDAFNVTAEVMSWPANTTVPDPDVTVGDIPAGGSAWSKDTFTVRVDMANPVAPCEGVFWRIEYDDAEGVPHVVENVPQFPPGEGPCD